MGFWIRNVVIAIILIGLGVAFFLNKDVLLSLSAENTQLLPVEASAEKKSAIDTEKAKSKYQQVQQSSNAAAEGLSNFYAKIYGDDSKRKVRNNIIFLPDPEGDLVEILRAREIIVRPFRKTWSGTKESRAFRKGETLYQKISEYATNDGLEVIWWINKDFIVKDPFRINKDILKTASQIGRAVAGHFQEGLNTYFCYRQRTLVFVNEPPKYLDDECLLLK
ncbi:toxin co-regulated pilus biosynthesis Q family protein [Colwellia sp. MSW7]|jgi:hypothetical protein|uniref:Toxin co-regulated pilus biosynthesis Q family protein n=1 Tax=Colwellia maritima TaxID=2912588 RepID=A0ABS9WZ45_9GAMM|nr:TcpQ domain-containing protein [Colwellia maritima]MCI2283195.1 toxin co-regulated pilus biosynthesis Q family protein [Colwellia maritima]